MRILIATGKTIFCALIGIMLGLIAWKVLVMAAFLYDLCFDLFKSLGL